MNERTKRWRTVVSILVVAVVLMFSRWESWEYRDAEGNFVESSSRFVLLGFGELAPPAVPEKAVTESYRRIGIFFGSYKQRTLPRPAGESESEERSVESEQP